MPSASNLASDTIFNQKTIDFLLKNRENTSQSLTFRHKSSFKTWKSLFFIHAKALDLSQRAHLTVDVGVAQEELLALPAVHVAAVAPIGAEGLLGERHEAPLEAQELLHEGGLQVQVRPSGAQELHALPEAPTILLHHVGRQDLRRKERRGIDRAPRHCRTAIAHAPNG